jgi:hypothetical protein
MIDRIFSILLTFCLLAGGTVAIGSAFLGQPARTEAAPAVVMLPPVTVIGSREAVDRPLAKSDATFEPTAQQLQ